MRKVTVVLTSLLLCFSVFLLFVTPPRTRAGAFEEADFINVGQGDAILLQDGNGFDVLIDGGKPSAGPSLLAFLRQRGVSDIDVMVASHADSDHIGGLIDVLKADDIQVHQVAFNGYPGATVTWQNFISAIQVKGAQLIEIQFPQEFNWGLIRVNVLNPANGLLSPDTNQASLVLKVRLEQINFLFTGDIDQTIEATVIARKTPIAADILKVAHHGSEYSSSINFLTAVKPNQAIISVGPNSYGQPSANSLERLQFIGAKIWRTDFWGTVSIFSSGLNYIISTEFKPMFLPLVINPQLSP